MGKQISIKVGKGGRWYICINGLDYTATCFTKKDSFNTVKEYIVKLWPNANVWHDLSK